jgi:crossover junction endodeoxyribonuclease RuvC
MTKIIGIDPGLRTTGWAVIEAKNSNVKLIDLGVIQTSSEDSLPTRLLYLHNDIQSIVQAHNPLFAAIEETYVNKNFSSSLKLSHARAAAILSLCIAQLKPAEYPAKTIKKTIVGNGNAEKEQVLKMLSYIIPGLKTITKLDSADALAVAVCHANHLRV